MSHHFSGIQFGFPCGDARLDFTDLYAFPKPGDPSKSILIMDVHPSIGVNPPGPTTAEPFVPEGLYEISIDTDGDAIANIAYRFRFASSGSTSSRASGVTSQTATVRYAEGAEAAGTSDGGHVIFEGVPVSTGKDAHIARAGQYRFFAGWRSDPFFFDAGGAINNLQFTGEDFFANGDVCSIVLEVPNSVLGTKGAGLWARTLVLADGPGGKWLQADRGARPSQTPFLSGDHNEAYRAAQPAGDEQFVSVFAHALEHTGGYTPEDAKRVARTLLPDLLRYDHTRPARFPDNGRGLRDDASDTFLAILTNGKVKTDGVGPHGDLTGDFPYVGPPHAER